MISEEYFIVKIGTKFLSGIDSNNIELGEVPYRFVDHEEAKLWAIHLNGIIIHK